MCNLIASVSFKHYNRSSAKSLHTSTCAITNSLICSSTESKSRSIAIPQSRCLQN
ncbi:unnamed protein product, partial [Brugia timori]|uniref:Uncharacterized protein n=1 Tax=Brugia timori TaxID=42155 RepID=A0A0R3QAV0_9BILA